MLQFITHTNSRYLTPSAGALEALNGGCRWIQLRMKDASRTELEAEGRRLRELCNHYGARLIVDDNVEVALRIGADGVHLGRNDMPVGDARRLAGPEFIIGATANELADIRRAAAAGADYIGLGPFRFTTTKKRLSPVLGLDGYRTTMAAMRAEGLKLPVVAIGGITAADVEPLLATGVDGVAISGAILNAPDPTEETMRILTHLI